ncbi:DUF2243 domain-containing protein [Pyxidicoccus fallax]|uniref:DUF2243 domain-containing protein n=1 Tax=Pyxidicoccus fallax TaxID=394095 RepID=A0A848LT25_9BACT|nr:DUF2243 domain-containing protein [Pyxidicoccus fallax]NMO21138.1 DUF2243 domain-containing protein [Pyxidicoccus fallax]NPC85695.1 DUF2243 domain-containing protein [Pyxidicoccus fallax]
MRALNRGPLLSAGVLLGVGLGGFFDGILLHQILQWHNMLSSHLPPDDLVSAKVNMFWDGLFHAFTWMMTLAGVMMLFRAGRRPDVPWSSRNLTGAMLGGWGLFNLVEGVIDHQLLGLHHVNPGRYQFEWDMGFLIFGALLMIAGWLIARGGRRERTVRGAIRGEPLGAH